jgi:phosphate transport system permease protein
MASDFSTTQSEFDNTNKSLKRNLSAPRTLFGAIATGVTALFTLAALFPLIIILSYLVYEGINYINFEVLTQLPPPPGLDGGGFGNAIVGTVIMVGIAVVISVPIGILAAVYLSEFSSAQLAQWTRFATNVLSGVPSIIVGVFAYGVVVLSTKTFSAWAGGFALAILMLPIIIRTTDEALKLIPQEIRQASVALGANDYQTVLQVILPAAIPAIITGVTLAVARAAGETAPLLFTALFNQFWPDSNKFGREPIASLAVLVYNFATSPYDNWQQLAWAASFILVVLVLLTSIISRLATSLRKY